jgi:hypothetical protein
MVLIRGHSELGRQIYRESFPERILPNARNLCKRCAASSRFWVLRSEEARLGRQREDRILVAELEILHD